MALTDEMKTAVDAALAGEWDRAHRIVQEYNDSTACWIHAVLHKIEGDAWNSCYWYRRTAAEYEDFSDPSEELKAIKQRLQQHD
jgi:hypothetical protein